VNLARRLRHFFPGATYHVMLRGNNGQMVFSSDQDRCQFCLLMQEGVERYGHQILSFCFMTNHIHLAIKVNEVPLSKIIQNLSFRYTRFCNWQRKTIGHLFQGRFKSVLVDCDRYLKELIRYIHLNPVRAKIVDDPMNYRWSSHQAYLLKAEFTWLTTDAGLKHFGNSHGEAMQSFHAFVTDGIGLDTGIDFKGGTFEGILGDDEFIKKVQEQTESPNNQQLVVDFPTLLSFITNWYDVRPEELQAPSMNHKNSRIRSIMALIARDAEGICLEELADFCSREASGMSKAAARLEAQMRKSDDLKIEIENLKDELYSSPSTNNNAKVS